MRLYTLYSGVFNFQTLRLGHIRRIGSAYLMLDVVYIGISLFMNESLRH